MANKFVDALTMTVQIVVLWVIAVVKAVIPAKFQQQKDVSGQVVLITGSGSGLGRLMSQRFAKLGCKLVLWDINEAGNEETAEMCKSSAVSVKTYQVDLSSREEIYKVANKVKAEVGDVDILVNNAGIVSGKKFLESSDSMIEKTMAVNANAHFWTVKSFLPAMVSKNQGHIVSIASSAGLFGVGGLVDYCTSKFAAVGFHEALTEELRTTGSDKVYTSVICPYFINTGMFDGTKTGVIPMQDPNDVVDTIMETVLLNRCFTMIPKSLYLTYMMKPFLPRAVSIKMANFFEINTAMDTYTGRVKKD